MIKGITINPKIMGGEPVIKGTRIPVRIIIELLAQGYTPERIIKDCYPHLTKEKILAALNYAAILMKEERFVPFPFIYEKEPTKVSRR
jgi:uncharacterized protein (DUF433 family)